ncbi:MAG: NYN domain-containing protein [Candidatus Methanoplasma sp.]|nr:NYN domain-containing protein [Candidatus Methanoplasma sp.]
MPGVEDNMDSTIALLIDAENISYTNAKEIVEVLKEKGTTVIREVVADWTKIAGKQKENNASNDAQTGWRNAIAAYSMTATQQFSCVQGKNTSDIALAIRAMKIVYEKKFIDTFCLVSNDSDFTRLAQELRENNKTVIGMGLRSNSNPEYVNAFSEYIYLNEKLEIKDIDSERKGAKFKPIEKDRLEYMSNTASEIIEDRGQILFSELGSKMKEKYSDFVPRNYGFRTFSKLMESIMDDLPHMRIENDEKNGLKLIHKKSKPEQPPKTKEQINSQKGTRASARK